MGGVEVKHGDVHVRDATPERHGRAPLEREVRVRLRRQERPQAARDGVLDRPIGIGHPEIERGQGEAGGFAAEQDAHRAAPAFGRLPEAKCDGRLAGELRQREGREHGRGDERRNRRFRLREARLCARDIELAPSAELEPHTGEIERFSAVAQVLLRDAQPLLHAAQLDVVTRDLGRDQHLRVVQVRDGRVGIGARGLDAAAHAAEEIELVREAHRGGGERARRSRGRRRQAILPRCAGREADLGQLVGAGGALGEGTLPLGVDGRPDPAGLVLRHGSYATREEAGVKGEELQRLGQGARPEQLQSGYGCSHGDRSDSSDESDDAMAGMVAIGEVMR